MAYLKDDDPRVAKAVKVVQLDHQGVVHQQPNEHCGTAENEENPAAEPRKSLPILHPALSNGTVISPRSP